MNQTDVVPSPVLSVPGLDKWRKEQECFRRLLPELLGSYRDQYVAVHEGAVVESGQDKLEVAGRAYARCGYVPIYVSKVTDQPKRPNRLPTPRLLLRGSEA